MGHHHAHHMPTGPISPADERILRRVTSVAIGVSIILVLLKTGGWTYTNAISLLSSLADSMFDVLISSINFWAVRYAIKPADDDHRFGHNSIEDIAGLAQFAFICGSMLFIVVQSVQHLIEPHPIAVPEYGIGIMLISLVLTTGLVLYQRYVYKRTRSLIVQADSLHYLGDVLMNISILVSFWAAMQWGVPWLDPILAILIAIYVIKEAWEVGGRAYNNLMDKEMPDAEKAKIKAILNGYSEVKGIHNMKTRYSGSKPFMQMHVELSKSLSFEEAFSRNGEG